MFDISIEKVVKVVEAVLVARFLLCLCVQYKIYVITQQCSQVSDITIQKDETIFFNVTDD